MKKKITRRGASNANDKLHLSIQRMNIALKGIATGAEHLTQAINELQPKLAEWKDKLGDRAR